MNEMFLFCYQIPVLRGMLRITYQLHDANAYEHASGLTARTHLQSEYFDLLFHTEQRLKLLNKTTILRENTSLLFNQVGRQTMSDC